MSWKFMPMTYSFNMNDIIKKVKEYKKLKEKYNKVENELKDLLYKSNLEEINKLLEQFPCKYSENKSCFSIEKREERNDNMSYDNVYYITCSGCPTRSQCYYKYAYHRCYWLYDPLIEIISQNI